jgi:hypothetical protein
MGKYDLEDIIELHLLHIAVNEIKRSKTIFTKVQHHDIASTILTMVFLIGRALYSAMNIFMSTYADYHSPGNIECLQDGAM